MARQRKPEKVDTVYFHDTGEKIDIMQNRNDYTFFADYQGESVSSAEKAKMPQLVRDLYARLHVVLVWKRCITISLQPPDHTSEVSLSYHCVDWAVRPSDFRVMQRNVSFGSDYASRPGDQGKEYLGQPSIWQSWWYNLNVPGVTAYTKSGNGMTSLSLQQQSTLLVLPLYGRTNAIIEYTPEAWEALKRIRILIGKLGAELHRIIGTPEGNLLLLNFNAANLLPAPAAASELKEE